MTRSYWLLVFVSTLGGIGVGQLLPLPRAGAPFVTFIRSFTAFASVAGNPVAASPASAPPPVAQRTPEGLEVRMRQSWKGALSGGKAEMEEAMEAARQLARVDPYRAMSVAMSFDGTKAARLIADLAAHMPPGSRLALRALLENPKWKTQDSVVSAIFENLAKIDPKMAWVEATRQGGSLSSAAAFAAGSAWAEKSPQDAIEHARGIADHSVGRQLTDIVFGEWMRRKPADFIAWMRAQPDAAAWAGIVPWQHATANTLEEFLALAGILPAQLSQPRYEGESAYDGLFKKAGRKDEYAAWIQALPEGAERDAAWAGLAKAMLGWNPDDALALLPSVRDAGARTQITSAVAAYRAAGAARDGIAYAESLPDAAARALALRSVASTLAEIDPAGAAALVAAHLDDLVGEMDSIVTKWSEHDPQAAAAYALAQKAAGVENGVAERNNYGLRSAMATWVRNDAHAASAWVLAMEPGPVRDIATDALAGVAARSEPEGALGWAMTVSDPELRVKTIRDCVNNWSMNDSKAAEAWVKSAPLDEELREKLSANIRRNSAASASSSHGSSSSSDKVIFY